MRKRNTKIAKYLTCLLFTTLLLSGCGQVTEEIPELLAPVTSNEAFRPVEYRTMGKPRILVGSYVPQEYCHFFKKITTIKEITCNIGQYVNEGDILAYADVEKLNEELNDQKAALALCIAKHDAGQPIFEYTIKSLLSQRDACEYLEDKEGIASFDTKIRIEKENHTYDEELYAFMIESYNKDIAETEKSIREGTLRAKKSGYVSYIKNTATSNVANINENVVIVSDYEDTHIEVPNLTPKNYKYKDYKTKYAFINGAEVAIEEDNYTNKELAYAKSQDKYPNIRFKAVDGTTGKAGDSVILYFYLQEQKKALVIGNDSANADEKGDYVYVKGQDESVEKRYFKAGSRDDYYIEVESGLEEGEMVRYVQETAMPRKYEPYPIVPVDYVQTQKAKRYEMAETINTAYYAPCDGVVEEMNVSMDSKFKKDDVLAIIDSGGGKATLTDAENDLIHLDKDYEKQCNDMDKQIGKLTEQSLRHITTIELAELPDGGSTLSDREIDAIQCQRGSLENEVKILKQQKEIVRLEYEENKRQLTNRSNKVKKNNDGSGKIAIIAKDDGAVSKTYARNGAKVELNGESSLLFSCSKPSEGLLSITMSINEDLYQLSDVSIGQKVKLTGPSKEYEGVCVGSCNNNKNYAFTEDGKVYVTSCVYDDRHNNFIASVPDETFFENGEASWGYEAEVEIINLPKAIFVPGSMIYSEPVPLDEGEQYFVWKIEGDELVKQYVTPGTEFGVGSLTDTVILTGLKEGDVLAKDVVNQKSESEK